MAADRSRRPRAPLPPAESNTKSNRRQPRQDRRQDDRLSEQGEHRRDHRRQCFATAESEPDHRRPDLQYPGRRKRDRSRRRRPRPRPSRPLNRLRNRLGCRLVLHREAQRQSDQDRDHATRHGQRRRGDQGFEPGRAQRQRRDSTEHEAPPAGENRRVGNVICRGGPCVRPSFHGRIGRTRGSTLREPCSNFSSA